MALLSQRLNSLRKNAVCKRFEKGAASSRALKLDKINPALAAEGRWSAYKTSFSARC
jgi:hypothetical protein